MAPSHDLPGREGTLVHPNVLSFIYSPQLLDDKRVFYKIEYLMSQENRSLCFECIENRISEDRKSTILKPIYESYRAETEFFEIENRQKGKFISVSDQSWSDALKKYEDLNKNIPATCIFCDCDTKNGKPFFTAIVIDKAKSSKNTGFTGNYQFSNIEKGMTCFNICFDDMTKNFPKTFEQLGYDLLGEPNVHRDVTSEIFIDQKIKEAYEKETGQNLDDMMKEMMKQSKYKNILRKSRN
jgi:hypothetical protein